MEIFKNKFLIKLIATICLILTIFNFVGTRRVYATGEDKDEGWGGVLLKPVIKLLTSIADGTIEVLQKNVNGQDPSFIKIEGKTDWWSKWGAKALGVVVGVALIAVVIASGGSALAGVIGLGAVIKISAAAVIGAGVGGYLIADNLDGTFFPDDIYLPMFTLGVDQIFANEVALLDVNFFKPNEFYRTEYVFKANTQVETETKVGAYNITNIGEFWNYLHNSPGVRSAALVGLGEEKTISIEEAFGYTEFKQMLEKINENLKSEGHNEKVITKDKNFDFKMKSVDTSGSYNNRLEEVKLLGMTTYKDERHEIGNYRFDIINKDTGNLHMVIRYITEKSYIATCINNGEETESEVEYTQKLQYDLDFDETTTSSTYKQYEEKQVKMTSTAEQLQEVIAGWYFNLRNIALVVLMLVLIYIGIRIVIGSTAGEKAKYKERLMDWLVALCLIFVMHYIMIFATSLVQEITGFVSKISSDGRVEMIELTPEKESNLQTNYPEIYERYVEAGLNEKGESVNRLVWHTDLMGAIKIQSQQELMGTAEWVGLAVAYIVLVLFTLFFAFTYLKRVVYMAFLTMVAPMVAMTYPIDKMNDGKAQAFNMWFREYIFNLLIQPMHLLLYSVLISSAYELAATNVLYTIVAIGFMMPAEKLVRKFFGFEKAQTPGLLGGAAGAALAMTGLQKIMGHHSKGKHSSGGDGSKDKSGDKGTRYNKSTGEKPLDTLFGSAELPEGPVDSKEGEKEPKTFDLGEDKEEAGRNSNEDKPAEKEGTKVKPSRIINTNLSPEEQARQRGRQQGEAIKAKQDAAKAQAEKEAKAKAEADAKKEEEARKAAEQRRAEEAARREKENTKGRRILRTIKGVSGAYGRALGQKAIKRVQKARPIRAMARGAVGVAGGLAFGITGAALGIASGDPGKAFQYTTTGTVGGYGLGSSIGGSVVDTFSVNSGEMQEETERSWYGEDYAQYKYDEAIEDELMSEKNISQYRDLTGGTREEAEEFLDNKGREYYDSRVTDVGEMLAIEELVEEQKVKVEAGEIDDPITEKEAIAASRLKKSIPGKVKEMTDKKEREYRDTYAKAYEEKLKKKHPGWKDNKELQQKIRNVAVDKADRTIRIMKTLESKKSDLTTLK